MSLSDPIADMLTRIRNGVRVKKTKVDVRRSKLCLGIARILKDCGFIKEFKELEDTIQGTIRVYLKYGPDGEDTIRKIERVSKPGCRKYRKVKDINPLLGGMGVGIYSTSMGLLTDQECQEKKLGGEYLARVN